jgi:hypothetical protein|tara:strand:+ start:1951 stop:2298 length:348 start_codon:yes stop_codon:yes gene_type:complete
MAKKKTTVIEMEIPDWANEETIPTITDAVYDLVTSLPKGYGIKTKSGEIWNGFHAQTLHNKLIQLNGFHDRSIRRTREALQYLFVKGVLGLVLDKNGQPLKKVVNGYRVKFYYRK